MPRPYRVTVTASTSATVYSTPWQPDHMADPFSIGIGITVGSTTAMTFSVQHTFDPIFDDAIPGQTTVVASAATWFHHTTLSSLSSNADSNYAFGVIGIRLACSASSSGTGKSVTATFIQAGP